MSDEAVRWCLRQDMASATRVVLLYLCHAADETGFVKPDTQWLVERCQIESRSLRRHLKLLKDQGLIMPVNPLLHDAGLHVGPEMASARSNMASEVGSNMASPKLGSDMTPVHISSSSTEQLTLQEEQDVSSAPWFDRLTTKLPSPSWPSTDKMVAYVEAQSINKAQVEATTDSMVASLVHNKRKGRWEYLNAKGRTSGYGDLWQTFQNWVKRPPSSNNGRQPLGRRLDDIEFIKAERKAHEEGRN
jgi:hypothetical protein